MNAENVYYCRKTMQPITIDGDVNKPAWQQADAVCLVDTVSGETPRQKTWCKLLWDDQFLYVAFYCEDDFINAKLTNYNDKIYDEEVVEVFIDDNCDLKSYIEIEVSPLNTMLHYAIYNNLDGHRIAFARLEQTVESAVIDNREGKFWTAEIAIPLSELITAPNNPPRTGDKWLLNLYRIDRPRDGRDEYSAWSPTGKINYHMPEKFGTLVFV
ncbi:MAG TPA: hypothetical protein GX505_02475 [Clostridiales bacterium]|nr:hypothetical protein [Clostridiales bacterium]